VAFEEAKTQEERIGENEALFRRANEQLRVRYDELGLDDELLPFICECGDSRCTDTVTLTLDEYGAIRDHGRHFLIVPGHELLESERVVEEAIRFSVVEKPSASA
jgi:hypothetical protein